MKKTLLLIFSFISFFTIAQKKIDYSVSTIPETLLVDKNYIVVERNQNVHLKNQNIYRNHQSDIFLILNKKGLDQMDFSVYYDKLTTIKAIELKIYNTGGDLVRTYKSKDFKDRSVADGFSIFTDNRLKMIVLDYVQFPYFVKLDYEVEDENTIALPRFLPIERLGENVYKSHFEITFPETFTVKHVEQNLKEYNVKSEITKTKISYTAENLISPVYEELNSRYLDLLPSVRFSNNTFSLGSLRGVANNWDEFGKWYYKNMLEGADVLPESTVKKIQNLTREAKTDIEKAQIVFEYVQNNTRYISIQKGIGGWKPFSAKEVDSWGYGDCKALTNYTKALLTAVDVTSYYTVIHSSNNIVNINKNVISLQGNHVILTLPTSEGNVFLECTSQKIPFGYLGSSTINRIALAITPDGAQFVNTQPIDENSNKLKGIFSIDLKDVNKVKSKIYFENKGTFYNQVYGLNVSKREDVYDYIQRVLYGVKDFKLVNFDLKNDKESIAYFENYEVESSGIGSSTGNDYLININPYFQLVNTPKNYRNRKTSFYIERAKSFDLKFEYTLPEEYELSFLPESFQLDSKFGVFRMDVEYTNNKLVIHEVLNLNSGDFTNEDYGAYRKFITDVALKDNSKFILTKK